MNKQKNERHEGEYMTKLSLLGEHTLSCIIFVVFSHFLNYSEWNNLPIIAYKKLSFKGHF